ncbi:ribulose-phosphate 3-epimerase [Bdellovibrio sp. PAP01]|uniref:Ribulose-phosphate 3-epimerase n=1 Tax=Bdellovibrio svalbardensis TaxID=2972972 RepID=A0ABT6DHZ2_9BACT|nr:ribulose-phosphate 3-epimerase [Bdellovibrio svalbardensis]MDG0815855.1 ribulose-phosphate 3-epimerase [Bdellovibrio svalbardensis]
MSKKMPTKKLVAPSILSADFANLEKEIKAVTEAGADWIHVDVMDGHFVPNITIGIPVVKSLKKVSSIPLDVHLMIEEPEKYIEQFVKAGSDYLTIHVESTKDPAAVLKQIRALGAKAGITLRPRTAVSEVLPLLPLCDLVLVMTVEPGFGGQSFMHDQIAKISALRSEIEKHQLNCLIEVDGGINAETAKLCHEADVFVAGSFVFGKDYKKAIVELKEG